MAPAPLNFTNPILVEVLELIDDEWAGKLSYTRELAEHEGRIELVWSATEIPIPLEIELTEAELERTQIPRRELMAKIRHHLPSEVAIRQVTAVNTILRNSNRRRPKDIDRDFRRWMEDTGRVIKDAFGHEVSEKFTSEMPSQPFTSLKGFQRVVEAKVDFLKDLP